jgi:hypothetical protein
LPHEAFSGLQPPVNDDGAAAEVFSLMSAKIEQLERELNTQKKTPRIESKPSAMVMDKLAKK